MQIIMTAGIGAALALSTLACGDPPPSPPEEVTDLEYAVHSVVLRERILDDGWGGHPAGELVPIGRLVIQSHTLDSSPNAEYARSALPGLDDATAEDFRARNEVPHRLERRFDGIGEYVLLAGDTIETLILEGGWRALYDRFPDAPGYVALSRVGFARDTSQALVQLDNGRHGVWGVGVLLLLERVGSRWEIRDVADVWEA